MAEKASPGLQPLGQGVQVRKGGDITSGLGNLYSAGDSLTSAGAMPARRCRLFMLVGFKQPMIEWQVLMNAGSSFLAWGDLSQDMHTPRQEQ